MKQLNLPLVRVLWLCLVNGLKFCVFYHYTPHIFDTNTKYNDKTNRLLTLNVGITYTIACLCIYFGVLSVAYLSSFYCPPLVTLWFVVSNTKITLVTEYKQKFILYITYSLLVHFVANVANSLVLAYVCIILQSMGQITFLYTSLKYDLSSFRDRPSNSEQDELLSIRILKQGNFSSDNDNTTFLPDRENVDTVLEVFKQSLIEKKTTIFFGLL